MANRKVKKNSFFFHLTKIMTSPASFHELAREKCVFIHLVNVFE